MTGPEPEHREAFQRAKKLVEELRWGSKVMHGALQACIYAMANDVDRENDNLDAEVRQWERSCEL